MDAMTACRFCKALGPHKVTLRDSGVHYADVNCRKCGRHLGFSEKPDSDKTKYRRPQSHKDLVLAYGKDFCEMCLRTMEEFPKGTTLDAHHVHEYHDGGSNARENIWIICTACHRLIHWVRTYHGAVTFHNQATEMTFDDFAADKRPQHPEKPGGAQSVGRVENNGPF